MGNDDELVAAPAAPLVLTILGEGDNEGYAIARRVRELSGGQLPWPDGMLYPLLHRLRRLGYVTVDWRDAPEGHRRRTYAITPSGRGVGAHAPPGPDRRDERMAITTTTAYREAIDVALERGA